MDPPCDADAVVDGAPGDAGCDPEAENGEADDDIPFALCDDGSEFEQESGEHFEPINVEPWSKSECEPSYPYQIPNVPKMHEPNRKPARPAGRLENRYVK